MVTVEETRGRLEGRGRSKLDPVLFQPQVTEQLAMYFRYQLNAEDREIALFPSNWIGREFDETIRKMSFPFGCGGTRVNEKLAI